MGPYNNMKNWDYAGIVNVFNATDGDGRGFRAANGKELAEGIKKALAHKTGPTLIECTIDRDDCIKQLMEWGSRVAAANSRPAQRARPGDCMVYMCCFAPIRTLCARRHRSVARI